MFKRVAITISLVIALLTSTTGGLAQGSAPQPAETPDLAEHIPGELLISFNPGVKSAQAAQRMQEIGLEHVKEIKPLRVHLVKLPPGLSVEKALERFSHLPGLAFAEPNYLYQITATTQAEISDQWGLGQINAVQAWGELSGPERNPILLATVDSGIDRGHPDLSTNIWINEDEIQGNLIDDDLNGFVDDYWGWDFVNNDNEPDDDNMHGTGVSSVMAGVQDGAGVAGVCPWCQVMAVKTMGSGGTGTMAVVAEGINYAALNGAKVINLSLSGPPGETMEIAVNNAWNLGSVVVAAAGNDGLNTIVYPSGYANAMGVASTDENDLHSCFSNHAENSISVSAPGERILIALPNQGYGIYSGTSLSAPHVAGLAGLLFSQDETGTRTNSWVRTQIETSAEDLGPQGLDAAFGHGRIDAYRALGYGPPSGIPEDGVYSISDTASGYAHARKLVRDNSGTLHTVWHTKEGSDYQIKYAYSEDDGATWTLNTGLSDVVYASENETYHPALATDGEYLFVAIPSRTGPDSNYPYEILFTRKSLNEDLWEATQSLMGGTVNAVRPDIYFDPTDGGRLHVIAASLDNAPYLYYRGSNAQGATDTWDAVSQFNPSNSTPNTRYAAIYANGDNIYVATKTMDQDCIWILCFTYFYLHTTRSIDGGVNWIDQTQISSYQALTTSEYGVSLAGVGDRVYMGYEVGSNIYFRRYDGAGWSNYVPLDTEDPNILYKWPSITQAEDGQAWMMYELDKELYMRHYDGSNWEAEESLGQGTYANLKLGTQGNHVEWLYTSCNGSPFDLVYGSRSLSGNNPPVADDQGVITDEDTEVSITLTASDLDDDLLNYSVVSPPTNGSLSGTGPDLIYTPGPDYNGSDSFTFVANDGMTNSNTATVTITVNAVNDPPVADDQAANTDEDTPLAITLTGSDVDVDDLTYSVVLAPANGSLSGTEPDLTYTPNPGYNGVDSFTFKINDGNLDSNIATVLITVTEVNNPPIADDQDVITAEDTPVGITLSASDLDGESLTYSIESGPANGTLSGTAPNLTYTPWANFNGADSFTFVANDGIEDSNLATVDITVTAVNDIPTANSQAMTTDEDTAAGINLTANDVDVEPLTYSVVAGPTNGTLNGIAPGLTYTPNQDYNGSDTFTFKVNDGTDDSNIAIVDITVTAVNDTPVAVEQTVTTDEDTGIAITLAGSDVDGDGLTYSVLTFPANGSLSGTMPDLTYTPIVNFNGSDSFNFNVDDGNGESDTATVTITVTKVNDSPEANPQAVTTDEDTGVVITLTGSDIDGDSLVFGVVAGPAHGTLSGTAPDLTYTPIANYNGADSFTFLANDGTINSNTATVTISVNPVNDAAVAYNQGVTTAEDTGVDITLTASDVDANPLTYIVVSDPANGTLSGAGSNLTYAPNPGYSGADSFTFLANDGLADSNTATVTISVNPVNDTPVAYNQEVSTTEDTAVNITLSASDLDGDPLTYIVMSDPANGTLSGVGSNLTYTPVANYNGADSFTFLANDGTTNSNTATVTITVNPVNDAPVAYDQGVSTVEDTEVGIILTASDVDGDPLTYSVVVGPTHGTLSGTGPDQTYTPIENYYGADSFTFKVNDGDLDSNTATVSITVTAINDPPVADNQAVTTDEDEAVAITLTGGDVEGDELTYNVVTGPTNGVLSGAAPNLSFTPGVNYNGSASFTFKINDGELDSNTATVTITVNSVNDSPVAYDQGVITAEDTAVDITLTASDLDGDPLTYIVVSDPAYGTLSGAGSSLTYTPDPEFNGADSFTFKANDGSADSNIATVDITVTAAAAVVDAVASGEIFVAGTVSGDYTNTHEDGGAREAITERDSGGKPIRRFSYLEHKWTFDVIPGNAVTLYANAWSSGSSDGDSFIFAYSTDDASYTDMFTVANTSDGGYESYGLPASIQGTVYVRVIDSDHTAENRYQDTVFVDHLYIRSQTQPGDPPDTPTGLSATTVSATQIDLAWSYNSTDEMGFKIERSLDGTIWSEIASVGPGVISYPDTDLSPNTTYEYRVRAYNSSGTSGYSNVASATTGDGLSLTATGLKVKGVHVVDLEWTGSSATSFDIYLYGVGITFAWPGNSYSDNTGNKGGASYQYQVCEAGSLVNCSNTVLVEY